jgi:hypothetical protein
MISGDSIPGRSADDRRKTETTEPTTAVSNSVFGEDQALALLKSRDLPSEVLERISKDAGARKSRKVRLAVVQHPKTPRHVSLRFLQDLYTFDLMQVTLNPETPGDVKKRAEEALIRRLETISLGEKLTLARRASGQIAAELALEKEPRVIEAALANPHFTELQLVKAIMHPKAPAALVAAVCEHANWSQRIEVRVALLRNENTPVARALEFARTLPPSWVRDVLNTSKMREDWKAALVRDLGIAH